METQVIEKKEAERWTNTTELFRTSYVRDKFRELLGKKAQGFITSVLQAVASNSYLSKADPMSVYQAAAMAATLDLPLNNNLGFAYLVPYNERRQEIDKWVTKQVAQFQMGYKGFIQLSQRTGLFKTINATDVREGEIRVYDRLTGLIEFEWIQDEATRLKTPIVGYVSYFELLNGFSKSWFMTNEQLKAHGLAYSQTFKKNKGLWVEKFDSMALKTVLKLNLSKYAPLSIEMQRALIADQSVINDADTLDVEHVDNPPAQIEDGIDKEELQILFDSKATELSTSEFEYGKRILENNEEASYRKLFEFLNSKGDKV